MKNSNILIWSGIGLIIITGRQQNCRSARHTRRGMGNSRYHIAWCRGFIFVDIRGCAITPGALNSLKI